jgi:hypothetical protein
MTYGRADCGSQSLLCMRVGLHGNHLLAQDDSYSAFHSSLLEAWGMSDVGAEDAASSRSYSWDVSGSWGRYSSMRSAAYGQELGDALAGARAYAAESLRL